MSDQLKQPICNLGYFGCDVKLCRDVEKCVASAGEGRDDCTGTGYGWIPKSTPQPMPNQPKLRDWTFRVSEINDDPPRRYSVDVIDHNDTEPDPNSAEFETPAEVVRYIQDVMNGDYD